jgi:hypothetical protein
MKAPDGYSIVSSPSAIAWHITVDMLQPAVCGKKPGSMSDRWIYIAVEIAEGLICRNCIVQLDKERRI